MQNLCLKSMHYKLGTNPVQVTEIHKLIWSRLNIAITLV